VKEAYIVEKAAPPLKLDADGRRAASESGFRDRV